MDRTRTVGARTSDFLSVDRMRGKGGQGESGIPACRGGVWVWRVAALRGSARIAEIHKREICPVDITAANSCH